MNTRCGDETIRREDPESDSESTGFSLRSVIEEQFLDGSTCDHIISRLIKEKRIVSVPGIAGGLNYYRLSLTEARARRVPEHRARPKKGAALRQAIQVLWFSCMSRSRGTSLNGGKLPENFGDGCGSGKPHCAESNDEKAVFIVSMPPVQIPETTIF